MAERREALRVAQENEAHAKIEPPIEKPVALQVAAPKTVAVFTLKTGEKIAVVSFAETDAQYFTKDLNQKMRTFEKSDVESVEKTR